MHPSWVSCCSALSDLKESCPIELSTRHTSCPRGNGIQEVPFKHDILIQQAVSVSVWTAKFPSTCFKKNLDRISFSLQTTIVASGITFDVLLQKTSISIRNGNNWEKTYALSTWWLGHLSQLQNISKSQLGSTSWWERILLAGIPLAFPWENLRNKDQQVHTTRWEWQKTKLRR